MQSLAAAFCLGTRAPPCMKPLTGETPGEALAQRCPNGLQSGQHKPEAEGSSLGIGGCTVKEYG